MYILDKEQRFRYVLVYNSTTFFSFFFSSLYSYKEQCIPKHSPLKISRRETGVEIKRHRGSAINQNLALIQYPQPHAPPVYILILSSRSNLTSLGCETLIFLEYYVIVNQRRGLQFSCIVRSYIIPIIVSYRLYLSMLTLTR